MADFIELVGRLETTALSRCRIPDDLAAVTDHGPEAAPREAGTTRKAIDAIW